MAVIRLNILGSPNLGVFSFTTEEYGLIRKKVTRSIRTKLEEALKVKFYETDIGQSSLVGILATGNSNGLIVPEYTKEEEIKFLEEVLDVEVGVVPGILTCLGNNVLCNDYGAVIHPDFTEEAVKVIEKTLKVKVVKGKIGVSSVVGSLGIATNKGAILSPDVTAEQLKKYEEVLSVLINTGTSNSGTYYVRSGVIANSKGVAVGSETTAPEILRLEETLTI
ncbi:MAG: translation initiation factor IF-6 [Candidatus Odinarchaeia archaeon]